MRRWSSMRRRSVPITKRLGDTASRQSSGPWRYRCNPIVPVVVVWIMTERLMKLEIATTTRAPMTTDARQFNGDHTTIAADPRRDRRIMTTRHRQRRRNGGPYDRHESTNHRPEAARRGAQGGKRNDNHDQHNGPNGERSARRRHSGRSAPTSTNAHVDDTTPRRQNDYANSRKALHSRQRRRRTKNIHKRRRNKAEGDKEAARRAHGEGQHDSRQHETPNVAGSARRRCSGGSTTAACRTTGTCR